ASIPVRRRSGNLRSPFLIALLIPHHHAELDAIALAYNGVSALISGVNSALSSGDRTTMINLANTIDGWNNGVH
ncbi:MAG: hypothetical protein HGA45_39935, partial [Chloroflexales bacterium]|nr:hypothetical protein [Chloroflexales bacterium]